MSITCIYGLADPRDGLLCYIGKSDNPRRRLKEHLADKSRTEKTLWLRNLVLDGFTPQLQILDEVDEEDWQEVERRWIAQGQQQGLPLTNMRPGGEGSHRHITRSGDFVNYLSPELAKVFLMLTSDQQGEIGMAMAQAAFPYLSAFGLRVTLGAKARFSEDGYEGIFAGIKDCRFDSRVRHFVHLVALRKMKQYASTFGPEIQ